MAFSHITNARTTHWTWSVDFKKVDYSIDSRIRFAPVPSTRVLSARSPPAVATTREHGRGLLRPVELRDQFLTFGKLIT